MYKYNIYKYIKYHIFINTYKIIKIKKVFRDHTYIYIYRGHIIHDVTYNYVLKHNFIHL